MKKLLLLIFIIFSLQSFSQTHPLLELKGQESHNSIRLNYILVNQPFQQVTYEVI